LQSVTSTNVTAIGVNGSIPVPVITLHFTKAVEFEMEVTVRSVPDTGNRISYVPVIEFEIGNGADEIYHIIVGGTVVVVT